MYSTMNMGVLQGTKDMQFQVNYLTGALLSFILVTQMYKTYQSGFFFLHTEFYSKFDEPKMKRWHICVKYLV